MPQGGKPMKKKYKCMVHGCDHDTFQTKHALATHLLVFHEKKRSLCQICKYHLFGNMDKHCVTKRFEYHEKISKNVKCTKAYKQKSALLWHVAEKHGKKSIEVANVKIIDKAQAVYETTRDFKYLSEEQALRMEIINELVEQFGE